MVDLDTLGIQDEIDYTHNDLKSPCPFYDIVLQHKGFQSRWVTNHGTRDNSNQIGNKHRAGWKWYNNGYEERVSKEPLPHPWVRGRMPRMVKQLSKNTSQSNRGKRWYNNGTDSVMAFECPDGYVKGRIYDRRK